MKQSLFSRIALATALTCITSLASAQSVTAKVVNIEPSYMPDMVLFKLDAAFGSCTAGSWIYYYGTAGGSTEPKKNVQAIYAGLLGTMLAKTKVEVSGPTNCVASFIHPTNQ